MFFLDFPFYRTYQDLHRNVIEIVAPIVLVCWSPTELSYVFRMKFQHLKPHSGPIESNQGDVQALKQPCDRGRDILNRKPRRMPPGQHTKFKVFHCPARSSLTASRIHGVYFHRFVRRGPQRQS